MVWQSTHNDQLSDLLLSLQTDSLDVNEEIDEDFDLLEKSFSELELDEVEVDEDLTTHPVCHG